MAKYTPSKSTRKTYDKWSNGYYGDYNTKYGNSSFWLDRDIMDSIDTGDKIDTIKLMSYQRAIANFVRILTKKDDIKVRYSSKGTSYTDGKTVTISSKIDTGDFDTTVGLALHEASHCVLTNFESVRNFIYNDESKGASSLLKSYEDRAFFKDLCNIIEDRRIDYYVMKNAPGYYGYYSALYDTYFNAKEIDQALQTNQWCQETDEHYLNHICNFANPNRQLSSLKNLKKIWAAIDLKNIDRLKSTDDVVQLSVEIYKLIKEATGKDSTAASKTNPSPDPADINEDDINDDNFGQGSSGEGDDEEDQDGGGGEIGSDIMGEEDENDNSGNSISTPSKILSDAQAARLRKAINKQRDFIHGEVKKKSLSSKEAERINSLVNEDIQMVDVNVGHAKCEVIVVRGMSDAICNSEVVNNQYSRYGSGVWRNSSTEKAVEEGWNLGTMLGKKLKTRDEHRSLKTTRLGAGRIDRRLIAELGFGNEKVFSQTLIKSTKPSTIHISLDASGSMSGAKWSSAMKTAVAIARAGSMIESLRVIIDIRGQAGLSSRGHASRALVWVIYDSKKDSTSVIRKKFGSLYPGGSTPEGLCYDAIMKEILSTARSTDSYFVNVSDGEPCHPGYSGQTAYSHTASQIKKMKDNGINILSYFVSEYRHRTAPSTEFQQMYGKDGVMINMDDLVSLSKTLNSMFVRDITE